MTAPASHPILVVDDEQTIRLGFSMALRAAGFEVELAANGSEAVERASAGAVGCILLDLRMPGLDGLQTAEALRAQGSLCPIVLASAFADHTTAVAAIGAGITDFLTKPIRPTELRYAVNHALSRHVRFASANFPSPRTIPPSLQRAYAKFCLSQHRRAEAKTILQHIIEESSDLQSLLLLGAICELENDADQAADLFLRAAGVHSHRVAGSMTNDLFKVFSHTDHRIAD